MKIEHVNDIIALILIILIPFLWVLHGLKMTVLPESVLGALIATWTIIIQYYFRKSPPEKKP